jgi:MinD-like ATPase involved in chromosome partitioning or flagellar assembly
VNSLRNKSKTEIIAIASGKSGTGKTLIVSSLGYALINSGLSVLLIDADPSSSALSLFLLGPSGMGKISGFEPQNTFSGVLRNFRPEEPLHFAPRTIHRLGSDDHGTSYEVLISGKWLYGSEEDVFPLHAAPDLDKPRFRKGIEQLFHQLRETAIFDYVLVDTRGGFSFESTNVCAAADSFIVVTEPDYTSFFQDRTLKERISKAALEMENRPLLKAIILNKVAAEETEVVRAYQRELEREFGVPFQDTHQVALDLEAIRAYQVQQMPYRVAPSSRFAYDTITAFSAILEVVVVEWKEENLARWSAFVESIKGAVELHNESIKKAEAEALARSEECERIRAENEALKKELWTLKESIEEDKRRLRDLPKGRQSPSRD